MSEGQPGDPYGSDDVELYEELGAAPPTAAIDVLAELAEDGPVLELGVGTGRVAIPLSERIAMPVYGIDNSEAMLARLRANALGARIRTVVGDFADVSVEESFSLIYVAYDTLTALQTQDEQVRCVVNVARHMRSGGRFVVEGSVPATGIDIVKGDRRRDISVRTVAETAVQLEVAVHDRIAQRVAVQWILLREDGVRLFPFTMRYIWPSELDLMARIAGLELVERWGGWERQALSAETTHHVSVYRRCDGE